MLSIKKLTLGFFILIILIFAYGLVHLFSLRFKTGDVYPPYSSLRSDPLGTRGLYESLVNLNISSVNRNYLPLSQVQFKEHTTFFYIGVPVFDFKSVPEEFANAVDQLTEEGGRFVMAFLPVNKKPCISTQDSEVLEEEGKEKESQQEEVKTNRAESSETKKAGSNSEKSEAQDKPFQKPNGSMPYIKTVSLEDHWGVSFQYVEDSNLLNQAQRTKEFESNTLPSSITWHTALYFDDLKGPWKVIYRRDGHPVIIEKPFKRGKLLLSADSYLFSNEALRSERYPDLLARLIGPNFHVVFDETHFGIYKVPGIAGLIRNYGFHWFFLAVVLLFILYIWKNSVHFVPPLDNGDGDVNDVSSGRDYTQGLTSLLRRNIPVKNVLRVSLEEWKKSLDLEERLKSEKIEEVINVIEMEETLSEQRGNPVKGYNTICKKLSEGNSK